MNKYNGFYINEILMKISAIEKADNRLVLIIRKLKLSSLYDDLFLSHTVRFISCCKVAYLQFYLFTSTIPSQSLLREWQKKCWPTDSQM